MLSKIQNKKIVAVVRANSKARAEQEIKAILKGGISVIEITLTTPNAVELIAIFRSKNPKAIIGAGSVYTSEDAESVIKAGAQFVVGPHYEKEVDFVCKMHEVNYIPGFMTPKEAHEALKLGDKILKLFPAEILGINFLNNIIKPYPNLKIMPSGGVDLENINQWLQAGAFAVSVGGSLTKGLNSQQIIDNVKAYLNKVKNG